MISNLKTANYVLYFETFHLFNVHILLCLNTECTAWSTINAYVQQYGPGWTKLIFRANYLQK